MKITVEVNGVTHEATVDGIKIVAEFLIEQQRMGNNMAAAVIEKCLTGITAVFINLPHRAFNGELYGDDSYSRFRRAIDELNRSGSGPAIEFQEGNHFR